MLTATALLFGSYLLGSISAAVLVSRVMGLPDPRLDGSGNPGATNVLRIGGKTAAAITLIGDVMKGVIPVMAAQQLTDSPGVTAASACFAFLGHLFPVFFRFRGGKGVATAFGAITALDWPVGLALGVTWLLTLALSRYSSLSSMACAALAPLYAALLYFPASYIVGIALMSVTLIARHKENIARLRAGTESRIGGR